MSQLDEIQRMIQQLLLKEWGAESTKILREYMFLLERFPTEQEMNEFKAMYLDGVYDPAMTVHDHVINSQEYIDKIAKNKPIEKPADPAIWRMNGKPFIPALMMGPTRLNRLKNRGIANWIQHVADHGFNGTELNPMAEWFGLDNVFFRNVKEFTPRQEV